MLMPICLRVHSAGRSKSPEIAEMHRLLLLTLLLALILPVGAEPNQIIGGRSYTVSAPLALKGEAIAMAGQQLTALL